MGCFNLHTLREGKIELDGKRFGNIIIRATVTCELPVHIRYYLMTSDGRYVQDALGRRIYFEYE